MAPAANAASASSTGNAGSSAPSDRPEHSNAESPASSSKSRSAATAAAAARRSAALAQRIGALCHEFKANDITVLSLKGVSDMTDYFVIASGTSDTHVRSTAQRLEDELKQEGQRPAHTEGIEQGRWAILDYVDVVVHLFHPAMRSYYQLERLWGDATVVPLKVQGAKA